MSLMRLRRFVEKGKQLDEAGDVVLTSVIGHGGTTLRMISNPVYRSWQMPTLISETQKRTTETRSMHNVIKDPHCPDIRLMHGIYDSTPETWSKTCMSLSRIKNIKRPSPEPDLEQKQTP